MIRNRSHWIFPSLLLALTLLGCSCSRKEKLPEIRNILLISLDTTRADHLGCYGYNLPTTPNIDAIAAEGIVFDHAVSPVPLTLPAHASMLTGTLPPAHGLHDNGAAQLDASAVTLAEILGGEDGMYCGAVIGTFVLDSQFGLDQGFDTYDDQFEENLDSIGIAERRGGEINRHAIAWLDEHGNDPFFLMLHYYDPHAAYIPPEPFASRFQDNPYAGEIAYTDHCVGEILGELRERGLYDSTLVLITADHGEMRGEHGEDSHGYFVYQGVVKVPLIFKVPGGHQSRRVEGVASLVDIVPTVCGLLGLDPPAAASGLDLSPALLGKAMVLADRLAYSESMYPTKYAAASLLAVQNTEWKYIQTARPELYNLVDDPGETNDLARKNFEQANWMGAKLEEILNASVSAKAADAAAMDDRTRRALESLGYAGGAATADFTFDRDKDDPKDLVAFHLSHQRVSQLMFGEQYDEARTLGERLVEERPEFPDGWFNLARIAVEQEDDERAELSLKKVLELEPGHASAHCSLAGLLQDQGRWAKALEHAEMALETRPDYPEAHDVVGSVLTRSGKPSEAIDHLRRAVQLSPGSAEILSNLGNTLLAVDRVEEAIGEYTRALDIDPDSAETWSNLGLAQIRLPDHHTAVESLRRSLELEPGRLDPHYNLARLFTLGDDQVRAIEHYRKALAIDPGHAKSLGNLAPLLASQGDEEGAVDCLQQVLAVASNSVVGLNGLAWTLATSADEQIRDAARAIILAEQAATLTRRGQPAVLDTLAAAYAADGRFEEAVAAAEAALRLQKENPEISKRLALYRDGKAYRNEPR
jgi:arylsulfatase A-like enzyme/Tfp pilus assembly protein PilF